MSFAAIPFGLATWLFDATMKGSVVILLVAAVQLTIGRRVQARWRHLLWLLVLVRLLLPAVPSSRWSLFNLFPIAGEAQPNLRVDGGMPHGLMLMPVRAAAPEVRFYRLATSAPLMRWIFAIWLGGALLLAGRMIVASLRMRRAVERARRRDVRGAALDEVLRDAVQRAGGGGRSLARMRILESEIVRTPALHGLATPTLLLPRGMAAAFTPDELRHVVLHELWHVRRYDVAVNWLLSVAEALHWFNPLVWFATSRIREERELACDERTLSCLEEEERFRYGTTILKLLERFRAAAPVPALVGIVDHKQKMKRRLMMITSYQRGRRFSAAFVAVLAAITFIAFTDARGGERHQFLHKLDPAAIATMESLHQRVSVDLTNATFSELLSAVGASAKVNVVQSADLASADIQQARFTVKASNVPAHAVLMESLMPFGLAVEPSANGATVTKAPHGFPAMHDRMMVEAHGAPGEKGDRLMVFEEQHRELAPGTEPAVGFERHAENTPGNREVRILHHATGAAKFDADGKLHRELTLNIEEDGVKSEGKLSLDITAPPAVK